MFDVATLIVMLWLLALLKVTAKTAFVVPAGNEIDPDALMEFVAEHVAPYKRIRAIRVVERIPKSPSGRILRRMLHEPDRAV